MLLLALGGIQLWSRGFTTNWPHFGTIEERAANLVTMAQPIQQELDQLKAGLQAALALERAVATDPRIAFIK